MELIARGLERDHGETRIAKRDLTKASLGFEKIRSYSPTKVWVKSESGEQTVAIPPTRTGHVEIQFTAKPNLNSKQLITIRITRQELAKLFFLQFSQLGDCTLDELFHLYNELFPPGRTPKASRKENEPNMSLKVEELGLLPRTVKDLKDAGILYLGDLVTKSEKEILELCRFRHKSLKDIEEVLAQMELYLGMDVPGRRSKRVESGHK